MKVKQRQVKILNIIRNRDYVSVEELAEILDISRETIRRDLTSLSQQQKVLKIHGGASLPRVLGEGSFQQRLSNCVIEKSKIATLASSLFSSGETLFIDTGTTTLYFAEKLAELSGMTVVTNSVEIAKAIKALANGNKVFLLGGEFGLDNHQTIGTMVTAQIRLFRAHHCVLTVGALDARSGAMDFNIEEAQVAHAMIEQSQQLTVLVDSSKFNQLASFEVCSLSQIDRVVCDAAPPKALLQDLQHAGIDVIYLP